ncbi:glycosyltransferase family 10 domain-containing protein [Aliarcobacter butzleri]|uniref:glycosyltransferase family 10 domain-containing protein n=1 Tax=Aliarcobacter butzleri TaxID=28197 RepID=UPI00263E62CC|nr:glycosyltransferase family 10 [Aliarcobacter butzleri]MDN5130741.1 glycosyltransferase family 10 [Aliarcobacter butzleri]
MKKVGIWNYYESLNKENYLLFNKSSGIGDNLLEPFNKLYVEGKRYDIDFMTLDMVDNFSTLDSVFFFDFPNMSNKYVKKVFSSNIKKYLILFESELIKPDNWDLKKHKYFNKIFTWKDDIIDNKKYFKFNFAQEIPNKINKDLSKKKKLCTLIAGNKKVNHSLELYSKRVEAIRWFEKNYPKDFDFYGMGWDEYTPANKYIRYGFRKLKLSKLFQLLKPNFPSYKGKVDSKKEVLEKYKFAICYENAKDISGYITEKIFDCFFAGCIPIYWGADNIIKHIPKECFIDKRKFDSYEEIYKYIKNMSDVEYIKYLDNIENFLNSEKAYKFSSECFAKTLIGTIIDK